MAKMLGRTAMRGRCSCCNAPDPVRTLRRRERQAWRRELAREARADGDANTRA